MDVSGALVNADGLVSVSSEPSVVFPSSLFAEPSKRRELFGSGFSKHGRPVNGVEENDDWSRLKTARGETRSGSHSLFPAAGPQMLSFSSWKPDADLRTDDWPVPFNQPSPLSSFSASSNLRNAGLAGSGSSIRTVNGALSWIGGPFTHSQWSELEHQALIYKYIDAKVPIPSSLLVPIRRAVDPSAFPSFSPGFYRSPASTFGWGSLHLGFAGNADPEPGRCRRTDGKKWRCSRDAVADQKYCERHMNRGRHRSRKRVEGHSGHGAKQAVHAAGPAQSASAVSSAGSSSNLSVPPQPSSGLQSFAEPSSMHLNRSLMNKEGTRTGPGDTFIPPSRPQNPFERPSSACVDAGLMISTDSQIKFNDPTNSSNPQLKFLHFIDDWSKNSSNHSTELSISIPMASSPSSFSPNKAKKPSSLLGLSCEFNQLNDGRQSGTSWIPISWEPTIGGPLGEALANKSGAPKHLCTDLSSSSTPNLLADGWSTGARLESSPTGVLQKSGFGSLSSSTRSSPRAENHASDELLGPANRC